MTTNPPHTHKNRKKKQHLSIFNQNQENIFPFIKFCLPWLDKNSSNPIWPTDQTIFRITFVHPHTPPTFVLISLPSIPHISCERSTFPLIKHANSSKTELGARTAHSVDIRETQPQPKNEPADKFLPNSERTGVVWCTRGWSVGERTNDPISGIGRHFPVGCAKGNSVVGWGEGEFRKEIDAAKRRFFFSFSLSFYVWFFSGISLSLFVFHFQREDFVEGCSGGVVYRPLAILPPFEVNWAVKCLFKWTDSGELFDPTNSWV